MQSSVFIWGVPPLLLLLIAALFPELDLWVSAALYDPTAGFFWGTMPVCRILYASVEWLVPIWIALCVGALAAAAARKRPVFTLKWRAWLFLILALAIGPGLIVNTILKDHWGRPRPDMVHEFGGETTFRPFWKPSSGCDQNCSFPSGHASMAFYMMSPGFVFPRHRKRIFLAGFSYGLLVSIVRMAQGGHFLSDVVSSFGIVFAVSYLLYRLLVRTEDP